MYYIGVDIGTTSTKSIVFDKDGNMISKSFREYPINSPNSGFKEQHPRELLLAVIETLRESISTSKIEPYNIAFISFSSMMHSIIAVDEIGQELTQCIIWADSRSVKQVNDFKLSGKAKELYLKTGTPAHPMSPFYKLLWLKENEPQIFNSAHKFISIKEYIFYHFFNEFIIDFSIASATGMFNIFDLAWDKTALNILGLEENKLSKPVPTTHIICGLKEELRKNIGLSPSTKFVIGASDGCLASLGSNAIDEHSAAITIGTSGAVRVVFDKPITDNEERTFCYILSENKYVLGGAINSGGIVYQWFRDNFSELEVEKAKKLGISPYTLINEKILQTPAGSDGLIFLPFLAGERSPYWNPDLRGSFIGISDLHSKSHFARAVIEGICYAIKDVLNAVENLDGEIKCISANGGFTRSKEWLQILCDIIGAPITVCHNYESPCLGAVMLGLKAIGGLANLEDCNFMVKQGETFNPGEAAGQIYNTLYSIYKSSVTVMTPVLEQLAHYQRSNKKG